MLYNIHTHTESKDLNVIFNKSRSKQEIFHFFSIGIHPWNIENEGEIITQIENEAVNKNCIAIGEIGLDKLCSSNFEKQIAIFQSQISISEKYKLPVILHCVKSWNEISKIKQDLQPTQEWIYHGFNKANLLENVLKSDVNISLGAAIFTNKKLQDIVQNIPNDCLFLETDDKKCDISEVYQKVSEIKKISLQELEDIIEKNIKRVFTKWQIG